MRDQRFEPVGVPENPVDHVAAVGRAGRGHVIFVHVGQRGHGVRHGHDVLESAAAPILIHIVGELLAIPDGPTRVRHGYHVSFRSEYLGVPAVAPTLAPFSLGAAVDQD